MTNEETVKKSLINHTYIIIKKSNDLLSEKFDAKFKFVTFKLAYLSLLPFLSLLSPSPPFLSHKIYIYLYMLQVLNRTLQCGEIQYNQRLRDIRLLKFEVKKLKTEKMLLAKNILNVSDLRQEVFHLNRDLAKEKLKVTALEEEIQTPLNIHRWRKLEVSSFFSIRI